MLELFLNYLIYILYTSFCSFQILTQTEFYQTFVYEIDKLEMSIKTQLAYTLI